MEKLNTLSEVLRAVADNLDGKGPEILEQLKGDGPLTYPWHAFFNSNYHKIDIIRYNYLLNPEPKYRRWTKEEAFKYVGLYVWKESKSYLISSVGVNHVVLIGEGKKFDITYYDLLDYNRDNLPCGTLVDGLESKNDQHNY